MIHRLHAAKKHMNFLITSRDEPDVREGLEPNDMSSWETIYLT